jgi:hypothetical protein
LIAGAFAWRALVAGLLGLSELLPNFGAEEVLRDGEIALLAVMALAAGRAGNSRARRAFSLSLAAVAVTLGLNALMPSYDAAAWWSWASLAVEAVSAIALLWGLFLVGRFVAALILAGMLLGFVARHEELALGFSVGASLLQAIGYFILARRVREPMITHAADSKRGLFRWSVIEIVRFVLVAAFFVIWVDGSGELRLPLVLMVIIFAALTLFGLFALTRFVDAHKAGAAPLAWATATLTVSLLPLFPVADSYLTGRLTALTYIPFAALTAFLAWIGCALSTLALIARVAQGKLATSARYLRRAIAVDLVILLATTTALLFGGWEIRDYASHVEPFAALALLALWLLYLILQVVAGVKLPACASTT